MRKIVVILLVIIGLSFAGLQLFRLRHKDLLKPSAGIKQFLPSENQENPLNARATLEKYHNSQPVIFKLTGDAEDSTRIRLIRASAASMKKLRDTAHYIKVMLSENTTYGEIVSLIDIMGTDGHRRYMIWENSFYIFPPPKNDAADAHVLQARLTGAN